MSKEIEILRTAMLNEVEGAEFYTLAAERFAPSATKDSLLELARQEEEHIEFLKSLTEKLGTSKDINYDPDALKKEVASPQIFTWDKVDQDLVRLAVTVFSIGMNMEKDSVAFYERAREDATSDQAKELFHILLKWEEAHLHTLQKQYEVYQQEWWNMQNFAPF